MNNKGSCRKENIVGKKKIEGIVTTELNNGKTVLATAICDGEHFAAIGYTNLTQAGIKLSKLEEAGFKCKVIGSRPYYIQILD